MRGGGGGCRCRLVIYGGGNLEAHISSLECAQEIRNWLKLDHHYDYITSDGDGEDEDKEKLEQYHIYRICI